VGPRRSRTDSGAHDFREFPGANFFARPDSIRRWLFVEV